MASGLIQRYAAVSGKPVQDVERTWRAIKRSFRADGRKREYDGCVKKLRESLGLKPGAGRRAYLNGSTQVKILAETPDYALVQVENLDLLESVDLKFLLWSSNGIMTVPFSHLAHRRGGPLFEMGMTVSGAPNAFPITRTATPATTTRPATVPGPTGNPVNDLNGIVNFRGRKAVVVTKDAAKAHIRFLDTNEETDVNLSELKPDAQTTSPPAPTAPPAVPGATTEAVRHIWTSIDPALTEERKRWVFEAIVQLEYGIAYLPGKLREDITQLPGRAIDTQLSKTLDPDSDFGYGKEEEKRVADFKFHDDDWKLIFGLRGKDSEAERTAAAANPLPEVPGEKEGGEEREGTPAAKNIPPASEGEVHNMLRHMRAARENFQLGARGSWEGEERGPVIKLNEEIAKLKKFEQAHSPEQPSPPPRSTLEKNIERATEWSTLVD
jgi:hypothetical protein